MGMSILSRTWQQWLVSQVVGAFAEKDLSAELREPTRSGDTSSIRACYYNSSSLFLPGRLVVKEACLEARENASKKEKSRTTTTATTAGTKTIDCNRSSVK